MFRGLGFRGRCHYCQAWEFRGFGVWVSAVTAVRGQVHSGSTTPRYPAIADYLTLPACQGQLSEGPTPRARNT